MAPAAAPSGASTPRYNHLTKSLFASLSPVNDGHGVRGSLHGAQGESLVPPYTRGSALSLSPSLSFSLSLQTRVKHVCSIAC